MKRVLMVAFHFPPLAGSSGIQRTLRFAQHLPAFGWEPIVLTADRRAYERTSEDLMGDLPAGLHVERAFALDTARHLSIAGRYPALLARPDRWMTWKFAAVPAGMRLIKRFRPQAIWSTYPIATAHVIGEALRRRSRLPWIADFRDPMAQEGYPADLRLWWRFQEIEEHAISQSRFSVFTTPGAARVYGERYPAAAERIVVLENGFDEESFAGLSKAAFARAPLQRGAVTLLHSGIVYASERDPTHLFAALEQLTVSGRLRRSAFKVRFRASSNDDLLAGLVRQHRLEGVVEVLPPVPYREALEEMIRADALLVLQAANCNEQIPAKLYEYLRARRPIIALTDPSGDTAAMLRDAGIDTVARLDSVEEIVALLGRFIDAGPHARLALPGADYVARASRRERTATLAALLDQLAAPR